MSREIDPQHDATRALLRVVGPGVVMVGGIFMLVGLGSFFSSFGTFQPPRYFWCAFVGMFLLVIGASICKFAFMGAVSRYIADEMAPVGKDVVNYMADGTQDAVRTIASAVGQGLRGDSRTNEAGVTCHACGDENESSASFCKACGRPMSKPRQCAGCGAVSEPGARFCDQCGKPLA
jgi:hypothetical protein